MPKIRKNNSKERNVPTSIPVSISLPPSRPLYSPNFDMSLERAHELLAQMQPLPDPKPNTQKEHHPVDRNFIAMIDDLKTTQIPWQKPGHIMTEDEQKMWNATRMREYRRKSNETLEKSKSMLDGLKSQCTVNTVVLKNMLITKSVEDSVKLNAARFLGKSEKELMDIPEIKQMFQQYWNCRKTASNSHYEQRSLIYLDRVVSLQTEYLNYKANRNDSRSPSQLVKKIKDATMKAEAYEFFMDDKRVRKVIGELNEIDSKFKENIGAWLLQQLKIDSSLSHLLST